MVFFFSHCSLSKNSQVNDAHSQPGIVIRVVEEDFMLKGVHPYRLFYTHPSAIWVSKWLWGSVNRFFFDLVTRSFVEFSQKNQPCPFFPNRPVSPRAPCPSCHWQPLLWSLLPSAILPESILNNQDAICLEPFLSRDVRRFIVLDDGEVVIALWLMTMCTISGGHRRLSFFFCRHDPVFGPA